MQKFLIATGNLGKFNEIFQILHELPYEVISLADLEDSPGQVDESGDTYDENARIKAQHFYDAMNWMTLGEDSGLEVSALKDELGLHTRRWGAGHDASDEDWLDHFLERMEQEEDRAARFVCSAVLIMPDGTEHVFGGEARGEITAEAQAPILPGLPLSSVFKPEGFDRVYAALNKQEKAQISHRGLAIGRVRDFLV
jgi:XTP/dITP diphosphohydrolase